MEWLLGTGTRTETAVLCARACASEVCAAHRRKFFPFLHLSRFKMRMQELLSRSEMHASYRISGSWKLGTGSKMEPIFDNQP